MNENYNDYHHRKTKHTFLYLKKKMRNVSIHKKLDTLQKSRQFPLRFYIQKAIHFTYGIFHEIFEVGIYIQKA